MLVGGAGTGKSVIINDKLKSLPNDLYAVTNVSLNFYTTSGIELIKGKITLNIIFDYIVLFHEIYIIM